MAKKVARKAKPKKAAKKKQAKKSSKKPARKTARKPRKQKENTPFVFVGLVLLALLIIILFLSFWPRATPADDSVLATVNGHEITQKELDFQYNLLPPEYQAQLTREEVLQQIINEELVVQAAKEAGITVTKEQVNTRVQEIIAGGGLTVSDLAANLEAFNITMDEFEALIERQLHITEYTQANLVIPEPSDEDLESIYEARKDSFAIPEQVTVQHILISNQREDAAVLGKDLYDRARAGEDFCDLVMNNTDDKGSRETCGEYTFPRGMMVPEFEEAGFSMEVGDYKLVQTVFGQHVMFKTAHLEAGVRSFEEVKSQLLADYETIEYSRQYQLLIDGLREAADVVFPGEEAESPEEIVEEVLEVTGISEETTPEPTDTAADPATEETLLECIAAETVLYGMSWSSDTQAARNMIPDVEYIDCEKNAELCDAKGVVAYPTWVAGNEIRMGVLSVEELATATGCE